MKLKILQYYPRRYGKCSAGFLEGLFGLFNLLYYSMLALPDSTKQLKGVSPTQPRVETFCRCRKHCRSRTLRCAMWCGASGRVVSARHGPQSAPPPRRRHAPQYQRPHSPQPRRRRNTLNCAPQPSHGILLHTHTHCITAPALPNTPIEITRGITG